MSGALTGIRVLDLSTPLAEATGRVLADLGAEVIKIEAPVGCEARRTAPFKDGAENDIEGSLFWRMWGRGKKSVVLDVDSPDDLAQLLDLVRGADIFIESSKHKYSAVKFPTILIILLSLITGNSLENKPING